MSVVIAPDAFAIMGIDPGGISGVAAGVFSNRGTVKQTLRRAVRKRMLWATVVEGSPERQAHLLAAGWLEFKYRCNVELGLPVNHIHLAVEDFALRQMAVDLVPVEVVAGLRALQYHPATFADCVEADAGGAGEAPDWIDEVGPGLYHRPQPSEAKTFATNERLKLWMAWETTRGRGFKDHARDATRHVCLGVNKCLEGRW